MFSEPDLNFCLQDNKASLPILNFFQENLREKLLSQIISRGWEHWGYVKLSSDLWSPYESEETEQSYWLILTLCFNHNNPRSKRLSSSFHCWGDRFAEVKSPAHSPKAGKWLDWGVHSGDRMDSSPSDTESSLGYMEGTLEVTSYSLIVLIQSLSLTSCMAVRVGP